MGRTRRWGISVGTGTEDHVSERSADSDSDQEIDDKEIPKSVALSSMWLSTHNEYVRKDGSTKWYKHHGNLAVKTRSQNIITQKPGVKQHLRDIKEPLDFWQLFFTDTMLSDIVKYTNEKLRQKALNYNRSDTAFDEGYNIRQTESWCIEMMKAKFRWRVDHW